MTRYKYPGDAARIKVAEGALFLVGGAEGYFVEELLARMRKQAAGEGFRAKTLFAETLDDAEIADLAGGGDLFAEKYLIVLRNCRTLKQGAGLKAEAARKIAKVFAAADEALNAVVFVEPKGATAPASIKKLPGLVEVVCYPLFPDKLRGFVAERARSAGYEITGQAVDLLVRRLGGDLARISAELEKLYLYMDRDPKIDVAQVDRMVSPALADEEKVAGEIGRLVRAGRRAEALALARRLFDQGGAPIATLVAWHLRRQFRGLLCARAALDALPDERFQTRMRRYLQILPHEDFRANQEKRTLEDEARAWMDAHPAAAFADASGLEFSRGDGRSLAGSFAHALDLAERDLLRVHCELFELESKMKSGAVDAAAGIELFIALFPGPAA